MWIIVAILALTVLLLLIKDNKSGNRNTEKSNEELEVNETEETSEPLEPTLNLPYKKKLLLTKNEWIFYKGLKPIADELGYSVLAKIRLADLVEVDLKDNKEFIKYFNKINKKHIDFVLAKPENLQIVLLIELDDNSHNDKQKTRDDFIDELYKVTDYNLLRVRGCADLKEKITTALGVPQNVQP